MKVYALVGPIIWAACAVAICTKTYTVKSGDSCDAIAVAQGVSSYQLGFLNNNTCSTLQVGQVLCVTDTTYNCQPVYTVASGDFCFSIANSHGITVAQLLSDNPQLDPNSCPVFLGLSLCVSPTTPGSTSSPSPSPSSTTTSTTSSQASSTTSAASPTSTACTKFTTVKPGESCDTIAQRSAISIFDLQLINPTISCSGLIAGEAICVDSPQVNCSAIYIVNGTEGGCFAIAAAQNVSLAELLTLNPNVNTICTNLYVGEALCVAPRGETVPPITGCSRNYTIVSGDTCTSVAAKNSLTNFQLQGLNPALNCNALIPGEAVCSFSPSMNICPNLVKVALKDTCFDLAQNASMSLQEWLSINTGVNCNALLPGSVVCSAQGNATLPLAPSGANPTSVARCGSYNKNQQCCTQFSVAADLFSPLCTRANGCQDNCVGDSGVTMPSAAATPTTTLSVDPIARPTLPPFSCANCTSSQCCSKLNSCEEPDSYFCESANGCLSNCDHGPVPWASPPGQSVLVLGNFTFPPGDYSATDGNPCGICNAQTAGVSSPSGAYCCAQQIQCLPIEYGDCFVAYGCLYNCLDIAPADSDACDASGQCTMVTTTVKNPFATPSPT